LDTSLGGATRHVTSKPRQYTNHWRQPNLLSVRAPCAAISKRLRLYDLRHTHASLLIKEGVHPKRISERLGHSSIKLTMDTYGHLFDGADQESAAKMAKLFGPGRRVVQIQRKAS
jgi:integrase